MDEELERLSAHFRGRVVLVTGALGFIGGHVSEQLAAAGAEVRRLHRGAVRAPSASDIGAAVSGDLLDPGLWERVLPGVDTVFHLAAQTSARASERDPLADYRVNAEATWRLLDACRRSGRRIRFVLAGTETQDGI